METGKTLNPRFRKFLRKASFQDHYVHRHLTQFSAIVGRRECIVDVGSGESFPYKGLFDAGKYVGLDRFERTGVIGDAAALPFPSAQADLVLCTEVLEHLPDPQRALAEINRVLAPGEILILTTPLVWGEHCCVDYQRWTEAGLRRLLQSAGFEVDEIKRRGGIFTLVGCMVTQIPVQVFGTWNDQRSWLSRIAYACCWLMTAPLPWFLMLFDPLDRTRAFTAGYSIRCHKSAVSDGQRLIEWGV